MTKRQLTFFSFVRDCLVDKVGFIGEEICAMKGRLPCESHTESPICAGISGVGLLDDQPTILF